MNKKLVSVLLTAVLLAGCSSKADTEGYLTITDAKLTAEEAETIMKTEISTHCKSNNMTCTLESAEISNNDINAKYSYSAASTKMMATATLQDVKVKEDDHTAVKYDSSFFSDTGGISSSASAETTASPTPTPSATPTASADSSSSTNSTYSHFDLPDTIADGSDSGKKVIDVTGQKVYQINISGGSITFSGNYEGSGSFTIDIMSLDQKTVTSAVKKTSAGDFSETATVTAGWYYVVLTTDANYSLNWNLN